MFAPRIAAALRELGHDVIAVTERGDLRGLEDDEVLEAAWRARRALVSEDVRDFIALAREGGHYGVLFTPARSLPRRRESTGSLVRTLDAYLRSHPGEAALVDQWEWLGPREQEPRA